MAQSFGEGFATGMQIGNMFRQRRFEQSIDDAGAEVQAEMQREKALKAEQARAQEQLLANSKPTQEQVVPSTYQQGDSLGLQGYQTGNKPVQTTVPTAPPGYMSKGDNTSENDLSPGGLDYPSANPATEQTLMGNYGTTAAFKGEKPTREDSLRMQQDTTDQFQTGPFTGKNEQVTNVADLAVNKPVNTAEEIKPKPLDTLNEQITAADLAKDAYEFDMRVVRRLQEKGNARGAQEYKAKVASTELTLAQADHMKFNTTLGIAKQVGNMADNVLESMQQPGADVNKLYYDFGDRIKNEFGYSGKIPFSLDPRENIKTVKRFAQDAATTIEKSEIALKTSAAAQKSIFDNLEFGIKQERLTLDKINTALAINKDNREQITSSFTRTVELTKLQNKYINDINSTISEKDKEALKPIYEENLKLLQTTAKALNIPMPNIAAGTPGVAPTTVRAQPGVAPTPTSTAVNAPVNTQPDNTRFGELTSAAMEGKPITDTAGGYPPPTPKTPAQEKQDAKTRAAAKENIKAQIKELKASTDRVDVRIGKPLAKGVKRVGKATAKAMVETGRSIKEWAAGKDETEINAKIAELQKQLDSIE